ncbi:hypothetical protein [Campylobacter sp. MIT 97-5078]|uniref:hypothetical protein n=1 Tax=Campylobacter sp. MIT 97-5078 TaxID=1548153 RepID=UPI0005143343|nr:hypothetical protein [Campylobacter sp. MIT 97-5078]KGI57302.1 hypothetical protein LR59_00745 [Campylobacter sp. MIT 97-5078]TQR28234.1 hypothetical protein DMB91_00850 [Campylobacter sp. MIT 97-5078]
MKKVLYIIGVVLAVILIALYVILFTSFGNKIVASYAEDKIKTLSGLDANLSTFKLRFSSLDVALDIANMAQLKVEGNLSLFSLGFDLDYLLSLDKNYAQKMNLNLKDNLNFGGKIAGKASDFNVSGNGALFGSNVALNAHLLDYSPLELKLSANGIKIEELLSLFSKPNYVKGNININADIAAKDLKPDGNAFINLATNSINYDLLQRDFNLSLPQSNLSSNITIFIKDQDINAKSETLTSYMSLKTDETHFNLANSVLDTDYTLLVPDLSKLEKLIGSKASGNLNLGGNASIDLNSPSLLQELQAKLVGKGIKFANLNLSLLHLNANAKGEGSKINYNATLKSNLANVSKLQGFYDMKTQELSLDTEAKIDDLNEFKSIAGQNLQGSVSLSASANLLGSVIKSLKADANVAGGTINASSNGKSLDLSINKLDLSKVLAIVAQPSYVNANLDAKAHLSSLDFTKLDGSYEAKSSGTFGAKALSAMLGKAFPANTQFNLDLKGDIKDSVAGFDLVFKSDLANLESFKGSFDLNKMLLNSSFKLNAYDFSKLGFLAERKLSGKAVFTGNLDFDKSIKANINSENLYQGKLNASLINNAFKANIASVDFSSLMKGLDLPDYYEGKASVDVDYNLASSSGNANANLNNGKLKNVGLVKTIATLTKSDLTKDSFSEAKLDAKLSANQIGLNLNMKSPRVSIAINNGTINSKTSTLNLPLTLSVDKASFKGTIKGTSDKPSINIDLGSVLKSAADKFIDDKVKEKGAKELNKLLDKLF